MAAFLVQCFVHIPRSSEGKPAHLHRRSFSLHAGFLAMLLRVNRSRIDQTRVTSANKRVASYFCASLNPLLLRLQPLYLFASVAPCLHSFSTSPFPFASPQVHPGLQSFRLPPVAVNRFYSAVLCLCQLGEYDLLLALPCPSSMHANHWPFPLHLTSYWV